LKGSANGLGLGEVVSKPRGLGCDRGYRVADNECENADRVAGFRRGKNAGRVPARLAQDAVIVGTWGAPFGAQARAVLRSYAEGVRSVGLRDGWVSWGDVESGGEPAQSI
jgi:hypothetical protein